MDERYLYDYFQHVGRKFAHQLLDLPSTLRINSKKRWMEELGASLDYWVLVQLWLIAPSTLNFLLIKDLRCNWPRT